MVEDVRPLPSTRLLDQLLHLGVVHLSDLRVIHELLLLRRDFHELEPVAIQRLAFDISPQIMDHHLRRLVHAVRLGLAITGVVGVHVRRLVGVACLVVDRRTYVPWGAGCGNLDSHVRWCAGMELT